MSAYPTAETITTIRDAKSLLWPWPRGQKVNLTQSVHKSVGWRRGVVVGIVRRMNKVTLRWARLVMGLVTIYGRVYHLAM